MPTAVGNAPRHVPMEGTIRSAIQGQSFFLAAMALPSSYRTGCCPATIRALRSSLLLAQSLTLVLVM